MCRAFCKALNIWLSGPKPGRLPKDTAVKKEERKQQCTDEVDRIPIEEKFGNTKR
ncbi:MAG: transposase [Bacteroidetes bacterium]|nr:transposase [Bacteroidota bacterium]